MLKLSLVDKKIKITDDFRSVASVFLFFVLEAVVALVMEIVVKGNMISPVSFFNFPVYGIKRYNLRSGALGVLKSLIDCM